MENLSNRLHSYHNLPIFLLWSSLGNLSNRRCVLLHDYVSHTRRVLHPIFPSASPPPPARCIPACLAVYIIHIYVQTFCAGGCLPWPDRTVLGMAAAVGGLKAGKARNTDAAYGCALLGMQGLLPSMKVSVPASSRMGGNSADGGTVPPPPPPTSSSKVSVEQEALRSRRN